MHFTNSALSVTGISTIISSISFFKTLSPIVFAYFPLRSFPFLFVISGPFTEVFGGLQKLLESEELNQNSLPFYEIPSTQF